LAYTYILECSDGTYYTGSTIDLERRLSEHQNGKGAKYTRARLPLKLIYYEEYPQVREAFHREKQIQSWNRKKKIALVEKCYEDLPLLSKKKGH
jgi:putative endonuclease